MSRYDGKYMHQATPKQHLKLNLWKRYNQHWGWVEKKALLTKKACVKRNIKQVNRNPREKKELCLFLYNISMVSAFFAKAVSF